MISIVMIIIIIMIYVYIYIYSMQYLCLSLGCVAGLRSGGGAGLSLVVE